ncbi:hypothetical protein BKH46_04040 [Helicobacter sp. 12S02634-8]|uniref:NYN domain-containing protein n=1 Tax=Helicobacter sp. 12S02634-8 TaxID=1476199 RepID=UPI000BA6BC75|nr:NYN domain-containing protein [Helicobacter sp. 12S02634-8]PAF47260.1 hypothetical protein BKH46_04040 [Helicobacter sp. 12S02634-8]
MNTLEKERKKVALFIDCENVSQKLIGEIMERLAEVGEVCVKKAYGDWRNTAIKGWEEALIKYSIEPIHIITGNRNGDGSKAGKNSSDIKITIDVINTLHSGVMECIALATSDSDFAPLAQEIRTKGIPAIGFGERKAREDFRKAFTSFEELGIIHPTKDPQLSKDKNLIKLLKEAVESTSGDDGKSLVSRVGLWIKNNYFKSASSYGLDGWGDVFKALPDFFDVTYSGVNNSIMSVQYRKKS